MCRSEHFQVEVIRATAPSEDARIPVIMCSSCGAVLGQFFPQVRIPVQELAKLGITLKG